MSRLRFAFGAASLTLLLASSPTLAGDPAQEFIDHFKAQAYIPGAPSAGSGPDPKEQFLTQLKTSSNGYKPGARAYASSGDPRQEFLDRLGGHAQTKQHELGADLASRQ